MLSAPTGKSVPSSSNGNTDQGSLFQPAWEKEILTDSCCVCGSGPAQTGEEGKQHHVRIGKMLSIDAEGVTRQQVHVLTGD